MRKLRFAFVLPIAQVALAVLILKWGDFISRSLKLFETPVGDLVSLCYAVNAPGGLFLDAEIRLSPLGWMPRRFLGIRPDHLLFLLGVALLWYVVGRELDTRDQWRKVDVRKLRLARIAACLFLVLWGIRLSFLAFSAFSMTGWRGNIFDGVIVAVWSLVLIILPSRRILASIRASHAISAH